MIYLYTILLKTALYLAAKTTEGVNLSSFFSASPQAQKHAQGYCWNGQACVSDQASVNGGRGSGIAVPESMAALLVLYILSHMF